jgi:hypothetical protein
MQDKTPQDEKPTIKELQKRIEQLEAQRVSNQGQRDLLAKAGALRRKAVGIEESDATKAIRGRIAKIAGRQNMIIEWTLRPQNTDDVASVGCYCGCGCSCIA